VSEARLDVSLAERGLARSRSQAADLIAAGQVRVNGAVVRKAGMRIGADHDVSVETPDHYVSRAAHKLIAGLERFPVSPEGRLCLDLGASTGGFTQVLLEHGAREVIALDVGHGQLTDLIRNDSRVRVVERCNARDLTPEDLAERSGTGEPVTLIVGDLSFISLTLVLPAIARVLPVSGEAILLIKPQFEVGRQGIREGIVRDAALADEAVARVVRCAESQRLVARGIEPSPLTGEHGNLEFLAYFVKTSREESA